MNDVYSFDELTIPLWVKFLFWCFHMVIFCYAVMKTIIIAPKRTKRYVDAPGFIAIYFAIYAVFYCVNPDYFSYREWMAFPLTMDWHREQVYFFIILFCRSLPIDYPYELFRLIVWGGGLLVVSFTAKMFRSLLRPGLVILFLFVFYSGTYSYSRSSLAMAVYFLGVCICLFGENRQFKMLGIALAICSFFFHHEMIIGIGVLPALLFPFEKRKTIIYALVLLAMMMGVILYVNSNLALMESVFGADEIANKMETYNERGQGAFRLSTSIVYLNIFYPFLLITHFFYGHKHIPMAIVGFFRVTFVLLLAVIAFFVVSGPRSTYTYRVLYIAIIPMSFLIAYCYNQGYFKNYQFIIMLILAILRNSVRLINAT